MVVWPHINGAGTKNFGIVISSTAFKIFFLKDYLPLPHLIITAVVPIGFFCLKLVPVQYLSEPLLFRTHDIFVC